MMSAFLLFYISNFILENELSGFIMWVRELYRNIKFNCFNERSV